METRGDVEFESPHRAAAPPSRLGNETVVAEDGLTLWSRRSRRERCTKSSALAVPRTCHSQRSWADSHGQHHDGLDLLRSLFPQVAILPELALGAGGRLVEACIGPCRARPADRSLVAEDRSARGVRDRTGPEPLPRRLRGLPTRQSSPRTGLTLGPSWEPSPPGASLVVLAGRATHVP